MSAGVIVFFTLISVFVLLVLVFVALTAAQNKKGK